MSVELEEIILKNLPWISLEDTNFTHNIKIINELVQFYSIYGEYPLRNGTRGNESNLAEWVKKRRQDKKLDKLDSTLEQVIIEKLPWLNFKSAYINKHIKTIEEIKKFYEIHNSKPIHQGSRTENETRLATYIARRRQDKKQGKLSLELENIIKEKLPELKLD